MIIKKMDNFARYETFIFIGLIMAGVTLVKLLGFYDFSSDWLWFLAGVGLAIEGSISLARQRRFDRKYKVIDISEEEKIVKG